MIKLAICGACGRMGLRVAALAQESGEFEIVGALEAATHPLYGTSFGEALGSPKIAVKVSNACERPPGVVIDFSSPEGVVLAIEQACMHGAGLVAGTTGLSKDLQKAVSDASSLIPIVQAPNMSLGMNVLFDLVGKVAQILGDDYDIEITETHHRFKKDAPSGSALGLAKSICQATGKDVGETLVFDRHGVTGERKRGTIGMTALRMGDVVGDHAVYYATQGERLELRHVATSRDTLVRGALRAAKWLVGRKPGLYSMKDVLGL